MRISPYQLYTLYIGVMRFFLSGVAIIGLLLLYTTSRAAGDGTITALTASSGNPSTISATVYASGGKNINNSNVVFQVLDKNSVLVGTYGPVNVSLAAGGMQVIPWSWTVNGNGPFSVNACWSPGGSGNCSIDNKTTAFSAVPSLGVLLEIVAALLIGIWFWRVRSQSWVATPNIKAAL